MLTDAQLAAIGRYRSEGMGWQRVSAELQLNTPGDTLRKRYERAVGAAVAAPEPRVAQAAPSITLPGRIKALYIPDLQVRHGVPLEHIEWAAKYAAEKQPDVLIQAGDWADNGALSTYDNAQQREGKRLRLDNAAVTESLQMFQAALGGFVPQKQFITLGNHEARLDRFIGEHPELEGALAAPAFTQHGWATVQFGQPITVNAVAFCHYFSRTARGWGGKHAHLDARTMVRREMRSCVAGHVPGLDTYLHPTAFGLLRGVIAGSYYQHDEPYMGAEGHTYWRGLLMLHEVADGMFSLSEVTMDYLKRRYGT